MKKIIALILCVLTVFSMGTIAFTAFAEDDTTTTTAPAEETTQAAGILDNLNLDDFNLEDLSWSEIKFYGKVIKIVAKVALKLGKFLVKLGIVDVDDIIGFITNLANGTTGAEETTAAPAESATEAPAETTVLIA